jgi:hypothetical protein
MSATQIATMLVRAGAQLSQSVSSALQAGLDYRTRENVRPDFSPTAAPRERVYQGEISCEAPITEVMDRFAEFAEDYLTEWRKSASFTTKDGTAVADYTGRITPNLRLQPRSWSGRMVTGAHWRRARGPLEARVPYRYRTRFELRTIRGGTLLRYRTTELPDPDMSSGYDLVRHFEVPRLPGEFGRVGERFLQYCAG